ncbi:MAG: hypothetical protein LBV49_00745, partial [Azonexus sp.]|nr:hypothetical protein [Azonexus sp.]
MLSFATEFPVEVTRTSADFLVAIREWLLGSPHTSFEVSDLIDIDIKNEFSARKSNELIETLKYQAAGSDMAAIRYTKQDRGLEWVSA